MQGLIATMVKWLHNYYGSGAYFLLAVASYAYLFAFSKDQRKKLILPVCFLLFFILNPVLYKYVYRSTRYWRWFWLIPNVYVIAAAAVDLVKRLDGKLRKAAVCLAMATCIVFYGTNPFYTISYFHRQNLYGLEQETVEICDMMLERKESPMCLCPLPLNNRIRQYSGDIMQYVGRDGDGFIVESQTELQTQIYHEMLEEEPDYALILETADSFGCDFVIAKGAAPIGEKELEQYGYALLAETEHYIVYQRDAL